MNLVFEHIRFMRIGYSRGFPWAGASKTLGVVDDGYRYFWQFRWLRLRKLQIYGRQYYMTICYPCRPANDCKMN